MPYELFYWPSIQGRGEFVRLALEEAGAHYVDVAREQGKGRGVKALMAMLDGAAAPLTPFAPPFLRDGDVLVSHVANILDYLGPKLGLAPEGEALRLFAHGLQLTITDFVARGSRHPSPDFDRPLLRGPEARGESAHGRIPRRIACRNISAISSAS